MDGAVIKKTPKGITPSPDQLEEVELALKRLEEAGQEECTDALSLMFVVVDALERPPLP